MSIKHTQILNKNAFSYFSQILFFCEREPRAPNLKRKNMEYRLTTVFIFPLIVFRSAIRQILSNEFLCPACQRLCNIVIPVLPPVHNLLPTAKYKRESFESWLKNAITILSEKVNILSQNDTVLCWGLFNRTNEVNPDIETPLSSIEFIGRPNYSLFQLFMGQIMEKTTNQRIFINFRQE